MNPRFLVHSVLFSAALILNSGNQPGAQAGGQRIRAAVTHRDIEVRVADDVVVRFRKVPVQFDDKGKPITPTQEQLRALKGDPKLPGYAADYGDLKAGQIVEIRLGKRKAQKDAKEGDSDAGKKTGLTSLGELTGRVIRVEGQGASNRKAKGKKQEARDVEQKVLIEVDGVALVRGRYKLSGGQGTDTLGEDVHATRIMILADGEAGKGSAK